MSILDLEDGPLWREGNEDPVMMPDIRWEGGLLHDVGRIVFVYGFVWMWIGLILGGVALLEWVAG